MITLYDKNVAIINKLNCWHQNFLNNNINFAHRTVGLTLILKYYKDSNMDDSLNSVKKIDELNDFEMEKVDTAKDSDDSLIDNEGEEQEPHPAIMGDELSLIFTHLDAPTLLEASLVCSSWRSPALVELMKKSWIYFLRWRAPPGPSFVDSVTSYLKDWARPKLNCHRRISFDELLYEEPEQLLSLLSLSEEFGHLVEELETFWMGTDNVLPVFEALRAFPHLEKVTFVFEELRAKDNPESPHVPLEDGHVAINLPEFCRLPQVTTLRLVFDLRVTGYKRMREILATGAGNLAQTVLKVFPNLKSLELSKYFPEILEEIEGSIEDLKIHKFPELRHDLDFYLEPKFPLKNACFLKRLEIPFISDYMEPLLLCCILPKVCNTLEVLHFRGVRNFLHLTFPIMPKLKILMLTYDTVTICMLPFSNYEITFETQKYEFSPIDYEKQFPVLHTLIIKPAEGSEEDFERALTFYNAFFPEEDSEITWRSVKVLDIDWPGERWRKTYKIRCECGTCPTEECWSWKKEEDFENWVVKGFPNVMDLKGNWTSDPFTFQQK